MIADSFFKVGFYNHSCSKRFIFALFQNFVDFLDICHSLTMNDLWEINPEKNRICEECFFPDQSQIVLSKILKRTVKDLNFCLNAVFFIKVINVKFSCLKVCCQKFLAFTTQFHPVYYYYLCIQMANLSDQIVHDFFKSIGFADKYDSFLFAAINTGID
jgi:hypothetical protein